MKKLFPLFSLVASTMLLGCVVSEAPDGAGDLDYFVMTYQEPTIVSVVDNQSSSDENSYCLWMSESVDINLSDGEKFISLSERFGDTTYKGYGVPYQHSALAGDLEYIHVSCQTDFNDDYSAGELLDDVVNVSFYYYYPYVISGYISVIEEISTFEGTLSEISPAIHRLIEITLPFTLSFNATPTNIGAEYTFDVEVKYDDTILKSTFTASGF